MLLRVIRSERDIPEQYPRRKRGEIVGAVGAYFSDEMEHKVLGACPLLHLSRILTFIVPGRGARAFVS
jgi:hypothetical protein